MPGKHRANDEPEKKKPVGEQRQKITKETIQKILRKDKPQDK